MNAKKLIAYGVFGWIIYNVVMRGAEQMQASIINAQLRR